MCVTLCNMVLWVKQYVLPTVCCFNAWLTNYTAWRWNWKWSLHLVTCCFLWIRLVNNALAEKNIFLYLVKISFEQFLTVPSHICTTSFLEQQTGIDIFFTSEYIICFDEISTSFDVKTRGPKLLVAVHMTFSD